jgi:trafficking protein particle complex subunit 4
MYSLFIVNKHGSLIYQTDISAPRLETSANDKIRWASTFHALSSMASQISPNKLERVGTRGIELVTFGEFNLHCKQTQTGLQFMLVAGAHLSPRLAGEVLGSVYQVYADYALKNPFYSIDMPIRLCGFNRGIKQVIVTYQTQI